MFRCVVQLFGIPQEITTLRDAEILLDEGSNLQDVIIALKEKIPSLEGPIFYPGENRLVEMTKFNVNGKFYFDELNIKINNTDRIALIIPIAGG